MNAVAAGTPAQDDHSIALLRLCRMGTFRQQPDRAAEDQRIPQKAVVVNDRAVDRRQTQLVSIIADAGNHTFLYAGGMQNSGRKFLLGKILWTKTKYIGACDGPGRYAHYIAHHAANACICAAERFQSRGVVVGLHFEGEVKLLVKTR